MQRERVPDAEHEVEGRGRVQIRSITAETSPTATDRPVVVGEVDSSHTLGRAVRGGLGATILPASVAASLTDAAELHTRTIIVPELRLTLSLCSSDQQPLSERATVVRDLLVGVLDDFADTHGLRCL